MLQLEAELLDERGRPAEDEAVFCQVLGNLTHLGLENGQPDDLTPYSESFRMTREGTLTAYFRAGSVPGSASVHLRMVQSGLTAVHRIRLSEIP